MALCFTLDGDFVPDVIMPYWKIREGYRYPEDMTSPGYITLEEGRFRSTFIRYLNNKGLRHRLDGPAIDNGSTKMWYVNDEHRPDIESYVKEAEMEIPLCAADLAMVMLMFA